MNWIPINPSFHRAKALKYFNIHIHRMIHLPVDFRQITGNIQLNSCLIRPELNDKPGTTVIFQL